MALELPRADKLRLMEALWTDLSRQDQELESPSWHGPALRETEARIAAGSEAVYTWEQAKARLSAGK
ncbi:MULTISPECIES: addiction module protein [Verrucomicrobium]